MKMLNVKESPKKKDFRDVAIWPGKKFKLIYKNQNHHTIQAYSIGENEMMFFSPGSYNRWSDQRIALGTKMSTIVKDFMNQPDFEEI